jgi:hypothetical protein
LEQVDRLMRTVTDTELPPRKPDDSDIAEAISHVPESGMRGGPMRAKVR